MVNSSSKPFSPTREMFEKSAFSNSGLGLLVIRSDDMDQAADFYKALGLALVKHNHPPCGEHYSTVGEGCVFEICQRKKAAVKTPLVFGFNVSCVERAVQAAVAKGGVLIRGPELTEWGKSSVVTDLDGNSVILMQKD